MRQLKNIKFLLKGLVAFMVVAIVALSCERRDEPYYPKAHPAKYNITGQVINQQNDQPIEGVRVDMGSLNTNTDAQGKFQFLNLEQGGSYHLTFTKDDYFTTSYGVEFPNANPNSVINISLTASLVPYIEGVSPLDPTTGGTIEILGDLNGEAVVLPNTIVTDENGDPVEGEINFTAIQIPNFISGSTNNPDIVTILFGPAGYQFSKPIQICIENPLTSNHFANIQLEFFNSTTGEWEVETTPVTYNSAKNCYETSITHFSLYKISYLTDLQVQAPSSVLVDIIESPEIKNYDNSVSLIVESIKVDRLSGYKFTTPISTLLSNSGITGADAGIIQGIIEKAVNQHTGSTTPANDFASVVEVIPMGVEIAYRTGMNVDGFQDIDSFTFTIEFMDSSEQLKTITVEVKKAGAITLYYSFFHLDWHDHGLGGGGTP